MRKYTRVTHFKRQSKRWINRNFKGLSDLLAILSFIAGIFLTATGTFMALIGNYTSVLDLSIGFMLLVGASDLYHYGRRR